MDIRLFQFGKQRVQRQVRFFGKPRKQPLALFREFSRPMPTHRLGLRRTDITFSAPPFRDGR